MHPDNDVKYVRRNVKSQRMAVKLSAYICTLASTYLRSRRRETDTLVFKSLYRGTEEAELWIFLEVFCPLHHQRLQLLTHLGMSLQYKNQS